MWKFFKPDGSEKKTLLGAYPPRVTPSEFAALAPSNGDEVYLIVDAAAGIDWHLKYNGDSSSAYKWEFVGGSDLTSIVETQENLPADSTATYRALTTSGPSVALPFGGDYDIDQSDLVQPAYATGSGNLSVTRTSYDIGGTGAVDADSINNTGIGNGGPHFWGRRQKSKTGLAACTLTSKYSHDALGTGSGGVFSFRRLSVHPIRISQS